MAGEAVGRARYELEADASGVSRGLQEADAKIRQTGQATEQAFGAQASGSVAKLGGALDGLKGKLGGLDGAMGKVKQGFAQGLGIGAGLGIASTVSDAVKGAMQAIGDSIQLANDKAEAASKANVLFGDSYAQIEAASKTAAQTVGMSGGAYIAAAGDLGNLLNTMGLTKSASADMSQGMIELSADLASFNNAEPDEVVKALGAALRGETEPARRFGIMLDQASIKAKAMEMGLAGANGEVSAAGRAQAAYALMLEQTTAAQGDFARTSDSAANQQRINAAKMEDAMTRLGEVLAPIATVVMGALAEGLTFLVDVFAQVAEIVGPVLGPALDVLKVGFDVLGTAAQAVGGVIQGAFEMVRNIINGVVGVIGDTISMLIEPIRAVIDIIASFPNPLQGLAVEMRGSIDSLQDDLESWGEQAAPAMEQGGRQAGAAAGEGVERGYTSRAADINAAAARSGRQIPGAVGSGIAQGVGAINPGMQKLVGGFNEWYRKYQADARAEGRVLPGDLAKGILSAQQKPVDSWKTLRELQKNAISPMKEIARLEGRLASQRLANGLNDSRPEVRAQAQQVALDGIERLNKLKPGSEAAARAAMALLKSVTAAERPNILAQLSLITSGARTSLAPLPGIGRTAGQGLASAIKSPIVNMANDVREILNGVTAGVRDTLTLRSPAKIGPWSENGGPQAWMAASARKITGAFAENITAGGDRIRSAWRDTLGSVRDVALPGLTPAWAAAGAVALTSSSTSTTRHEATITIRHELAPGAARDLRAAGFDTDQLQEVLEKANRMASVQYARSRDYGGGGEIEDFVRDFARATRIPMEPHF